MEATVSLASLSNKSKLSKRAPHASYTKTVSFAIVVVLGHILLRMFIVIDHV